VWPPPPVDKAWVYFLLTLGLTVIAVLLLRRFLFAPFGYAMRAGRDSPLRAEAIGIDVKRVHWLGFAVAGCVCGIAGGLFAFAKGSISPETIHVSRSIDGLVMVLLGGIQTLTGPIVGASVYATLQDTVMRQTEYWRALLASSSCCWFWHFRRASSALSPCCGGAWRRSRDRARHPFTVQGFWRRARRQ
jgi:branched-chain amino acid transport system permease protein